MPDNDLREWKDADRISDRIVDLLREEMKRPHFSPMQMFVGQMLAMMAMLRTAEGLHFPAELALVREAIRRCLQSVIHAHKHDA